MNSTNFNPYNQTITLQALDRSKIPITVNEIDGYVKYGIRICINFSSSVGASTILLACLVLLARPDMRTTPVFILNALGLVFNIIRAICECLYFTSSFYDFYIYWSGDYSSISTSPIAISVTGIVFTLLLITCIECSLVLQVQVVVGGPNIGKLQRLAIMSASIAVALTAVAFRLALTVQNARAIVALSITPLWLIKTSTYITSASICFFSFIFVSKLAVALHRRRRTLSMQKFGPMEILFISSCQTMTIPALFAVLENVSSVPELASQMLTLTAIFTPLSSLWASTHIENQNRGAGINTHNTAKKARTGLFSSLALGTKGRVLSLSSSKKQLDLEMAEPNSATTTKSTSSPRHAHNYSENSIDLDARKVDTRGFSTHTGPSRVLPDDDDDDDDLERDLQVYAGRGSR